MSPAGMNPENQTGTRGSGVGLSGLLARFLRNPLPKFFCLLTAATLWFVVNAERLNQVEQAYEVKINIRDTALGGDLRQGLSGAATSKSVDFKPEYVRVVLSGRPARLQEIRPEQIEALVDVRDIEGAFSQVIQISAPAQTRVMSYTPRRVKGVVDAQLSKSWPVLATLLSDSEDVLAPSAIVLQPQQVMVTGSSRQLGKISRVVTMPLSLSAGSSRDIGLWALDVNGQVLNGLQFEPSTIRIRHIGNEPPTLSSPTFPSLLRGGGMIEVP